MHTVPAMHDLPPTHHWLWSQNPLSPARGSWWPPVPSHCWVLALNHLAQMSKYYCQEVSLGTLCMAQGAPSPKINEKLSVGIKSICVLYLYLEIEFAKPLAQASDYRSSLTTVAAESDQIITYFCLQICPFLREGLTLNTRFIQFSFTILLVFKSHSLSALF